MVISYPPLCWCCYLSWTDGRTGLFIYVRVWRVLRWFASPAIGGWAWFLPVPPRLRFAVTTARYLGLPRDAVLRTPPLHTFPSAPRTRLPAHTATPPLRRHNAPPSDNTPCQRLDRVSLRRRPLHRHLLCAPATAGFARRLTRRREHLPNNNADDGVTAALADIFIYQPAAWQRLRLPPTASRILLPLLPRCYGARLGWLPWTPSCRALARSFCI